MISGARASDFEPSQNNSFVRSKVYDEVPGVDTRERVKMLRKSKPVARHPVFLTEGQRGHRQRMRDRLDRDPDGLADYEMLEMLLFLVQPHGDTKPLAKRLINQFGSYGRVVTASPARLLRVDGMTRNKIVVMKLVCDARVSLAQEEAIDRVALSSWEYLLAYLDSTVAREEAGHFNILFLDARNYLIQNVPRTTEATNNAAKYVREVAKLALRLHASAVIICRHEQTCDPRPDFVDREIGNNIQSVLKSLNITLHDYIVFGNGKYVSLKARALI